MDVRAVWRVSRVVSGMYWADTVTDVQPHVDRRGLSEIERIFSVLSDDYAFHRSGATLSSRGTSVT